MNQPRDQIQGITTPSNTNTKQYYRRKPIMPPALYSKVARESIQAQPTPKSHGGDLPQLQVQKLFATRLFNRQNPLNRTNDGDRRLLADSKLFEDELNITIQETNSSLLQDWNTPRISNRAKIRDYKFFTRPKDRAKIIAQLETQRDHPNGVYHKPESKNLSFECERFTPSRQWGDNLHVRGKSDRGRTANKETLEKFQVTKKVSIGNFLKNYLLDNPLGKVANTIDFMQPTQPPSNAKKAAQMSLEELIRWNTFDGRAKASIEAKLADSREKGMILPTAAGSSNTQKPSFIELARWNTYDERIKTAATGELSARERSKSPGKEGVSPLPLKGIMKKELSPVRPRVIRHEQGASSLSPRSCASRIIRRNLNKLDVKDQMNRLKKQLLVTIRPEIIVDQKKTKKNKARNKFLLQPSAYQNRPPTVLFYCTEKLRKRPLSEDAFEVSLEEPLVFQNLVGYDCIQSVFVTSGLDCADDEEDDQWDICWGWLSTGEIIQNMNRHQRLNHFPGSKALGRKDSLWKNFSKMKNKFPQDYNYMPPTFILTTDHLLFQAYQQNSPEDALWIAKPVASACGKGIFLVNKTTHVEKKKNYLISNYISNPHLINDLKYDLRVYVLVTCYDPLRIYIFNEGLVRFATEPYSLEKIKMKNMFSHLTNYAINKESKLYKPSTGIEEEDDKASKWTFAQYRKKLESMGVDFNIIWNGIKDIVIKTAISVESIILDRSNRVHEHNKNCFELYGFDILVDSDLKSWLMEVNIYPSLRTDSILDKIIKTRLVCDTLNLAGLRAPEAWEVPSQQNTCKLPAPKKDLLSRYVRDLDNLNEDNIFDKLSAEDWEILFESEEELFRQGDYELIFPLKDNIDTYKKFFEVDRFNNLMLWGFKKMKNNPLLKITPLAKQ